MTIAMKIAMTGALAILISLPFIRGPYPGNALGLPILAFFVCGCIAAIVGLVMAIWGIS